MKEKLRYPSTISHRSCAVYIQKKNRTRYFELRYSHRKIASTRKIFQERIFRPPLYPYTIRKDEKKLSFNEFLSSLYRGTFGLKSCQAERASRKNQVQAFQTSESRPMSSSLIPTHDREVRPKIQSSSVE